MDVWYRQAYAQIAITPRVTITVPLKWPENFTFSRKSDKIAEIISASKIFVSPRSDWMDRKVIEDTAIFRKYKTLKSVHTWILNDYNRLIIFSYYFQRHSKPRKLIRTVIYNTNCGEHKVMNSFMIRAILHDPYGVELLNRRWI